MLKHVRTYHNNCLKGIICIQTKFKKNKSVSFVIDASLEENNTFDEEMELSNDDCDEGAIPKIELALMKKAASQLLMKLQAIDFVPVLTLNAITEELGAIQERNLNFIINRLEQIFEEHCEDQTLKEQINNIIKQSDVFGACFGSSGDLKSNYSRMNFYERVYNFEKPVEEYLYTSERGKKHSHYFVLPSTHLKQYLMNPMLKKYLAKNRTSPGNNDSVFSDIKDGLLYKRNRYFKENQNAFAIILFQDAFTAASSLGSARKTYKYVATYMTMADFPAHCRMNINTIKLISLLAVDDIKKVTKEVAYGSIIKNLKLLEEEGINVNGANYKAGLLMICGDNLGAHEVGGFLQAFHSGVNYICRFCLIEGQNLNEKKVSSMSAHKYEWRTPANYDTALTMLPSSSENDSYHGIKEKCMFNVLESFHCCTPALAPCLAHDIFEGIYDLLLFIRYFINEGYFTLDELNEKILAFPFVGDDADNKPHAISKEKLKKSNNKLSSNTASEMWLLLRFIPIFILQTQKDNKIKSDKVWKQLIHLREIVSLVTKYTYTKNEICYLHVRLEAYIENRLKIFPNENITAKFHYLLHYPQLIFYFGPLIKVWTMRFEHKHQYLKRCVQRKKNFINATKTVSIHAQLAEAYFLSCTENEENISFEGVIKPYLTTSIEDEAALLIEGYFKDKTFLSIVNNVQCFGITYKKGHLLIIDEDEDRPKMGK